MCIISLYLFPQNQISTAKQVCGYLLTARNAVVVVICAGIASIMHDLYDIRGEGSLSLTGNITAGLPTPSVPKFELHGFDEKTNSTVHLDLGDISSVS